ncbi:MAG: hypothetical protein AAGE52_05855 [Myxococcota bacterium]
MRALVFALTLGLTSVAMAQPGAPGDSINPPSAGQFWNRGENRGFLAVSFDLGFLYLRPRLSAGWGKPHRFWVGIDANPIVQVSAAGSYVGLRFAHPNVNFRVGPRYGVAYNRSYLDPQDEFIERDYAIMDNSAASYLSWDAELTLSMEVGELGELFSETSVVYISRVPANRFVLEESIRVIVDPPWVWRQRVGYAFRFGAERAVSVGVTAEIIGVPKRDYAMLRGGLILRWHITPQLQVRGTFITALVSRDRVGNVNGQMGLLGLRWRWATGMPTQLEETPEEGAEAAEEGDEPSIDEPR